MEKGFITYYSQFHQELRLLVQRKSRRIHEIDFDARTVDMRVERGWIETFNISRWTLDDYGANWRNLVATVLWGMRRKLRGLPPIPERKASQ